MKHAIKEKLFISLAKLYDTSPFFYYFKRRVETRILKNMPAMAAVGYSKKQDQFVLYFREKELNDASWQDICGMIEHELSHLCLNHLSTMKKDKYNKTIMNIAQDLIINDTSNYIGGRYSELFSATYDGVFAQVNPKTQVKEVAICTGRAFHEKNPKIPSICKDSTSFELYDILKEEQKNKQDQQKGDSPANFDIHEMLDADKVQDGQPMSLEEFCDAFGLSDEQKQDIEDKIKRDLKDIVGKLDSQNKSMGNIPSELEVLIESLKKSKSNFKQNLNMFLNSCKRDDFKKTWYKINKRYPYAQKGRKYERKPVLAIGLDLSGSMINEETLALMNYEVQMYAKECRELWLIAGDTKLNLLEQIKNGKCDLAKIISKKGGGGTDLQFMWDKARDLKVDGLICHTDGYIPDFKDMGVKTLFAVYPGGKKIDGYKNVVVE